MTMNNPLAGVLSRIQNAERLGKRQVTTHLNGKIIRAVLDILKGEGFIAGYEVVRDAKGDMLKISLNGRLNKTGVIAPRFNVKRDGFVTFEKRYLPSKDFGVLIITTTKGILTHKNAKDANLGGRLIAYAY
nr:30S ribosomal protein S8 [uncultured archaeon]